MRQHTKNKEGLSKTSSNYFLKSDHLNVNLKERSIRGGTVIMVAQASKFILNLGSTVVLARLLTPNDYGIIAMVIAVTGFMAMFKDMGLSMATVQRDEITQDQISTLFWINVSIGIAIMLVTISLSPVIVWFYGEPRLAWITIALSGGFVFGGLTVQHQALLRRQMHFTALAGIDISSLLVGIVTALLTAWYGAGYWALVFMQLAVAITTAIGVWIMCDWRPGMPIRRSGVRSMLAFGGNLSGFSVINYFARNLDNILIGRYWGAQQLGLYSKAYQLLLLPIQQINAPITSVAIPALSRLQNDPERYRRYYCSAMSLIAFVTSPLIVIMAVLSDELILIVLGTQWIGASTIFKVLAIAAFGQPLTNTTGWIYISLGQTDRFLKWGLFSTSLYILSFAIGISWGALGVAIAYAICAHIIRPPLFFYTFRYSPVKTIDLINATWRPMTISLVMYVVMELTHSFLSSEPPMLVIIYTCLMGLIALIVTTLIWPKARSEALKLLGYVKIITA